MNALDPIKEDQGQPRKWWQWLLLNPTLVVGLGGALIGAIPQYLTWIQAFRMGVPSNQVFSAKTQNELWNKNADCAKTLPRPITIEENIQVSVNACSSGDVLVKVLYPGEKELYRWIPFKMVTASSLETRVPVTRDLTVDFLAASWGASQAVLLPFAGERTVSEFRLGQTQKQVICQRWLGNGRLLRRIRDASMCYDEIINTYTGKVEERKAAECKTPC
jgi:hypothetical protein